jgi:DNA repair exonuclease SbcCD ATPase subunit
MNEVFSKLQNELSSFQQDNQRLSKVNSNLEDQLSKYAILLHDEKSERKEITEKYDSLQEKFTDEIRVHAKEKIHRTKRYYLLLALCFSIIILLIRQLAPVVIDTIS